MGGGRFGLPHTVTCTCQLQQLVKCHPPLGKNPAASRVPRCRDCAPASRSDLELKRNLPSLSLSASSNFPYHHLLLFNLVSIIITNSSRSELDTTSRPTDPRKNLYDVFSTQPAPQHPDVDRLPQHNPRRPELGPLLLCRTPPP